MRTLVTHDMPMIDENGTVHDALVILIPFLILQPQSNLLEDLGNIESSLNSCKKKKWFIVLVVISLGIIVSIVIIHCRKYLIKLHNVRSTLY